MEVKKKTAKKVLNELLFEISGEDPRVEDGYARRFRESIKTIFGQDSDFFTSAKKINFLSAHPTSTVQWISQNNSDSSCGIARDLLKSCIKHLVDFETYKPHKKNYLEGIANGKVLLIFGGILLVGMAISDLFHGSESLITNILSVLVSKIY
jgi:hypothetical protein